MSLSVVRPYFRTRCEALNYKEHEDGFNFESIPAGMFERAYNISAPSTSVKAQHMSHVELTTQVTVSLFTMAIRSTSLKIDTVISTAETLMKECCKVSNSLASSNIKKVDFLGMRVEPVDPSNNTAFKVELEFQVLTIIDLNN